MDIYSREDAERIANALNDWLAVLAEETAEQLRADQAEEL